VNLGLGIGREECCYQVHTHTHTHTPKRGGGQ